MARRVKFFFTNLTKIAGNLYEDVCLFMIIYLWNLLSVRNIKQNLYKKSKHIFLYRSFLFENRVVYEIMWKNTVVPDRGHRKQYGARNIVCWIPKATNTHSEYVILIFLLQHRWQEYALVLRSTLIDCLARNAVVFPQFLPSHRMNKK